MDPDEYRRTSLENWQRMAAGWERSRERLEATARPVRQWLVRELDARPGETVLELAAGPGETGFEAAARIGERGLLISSDRAPAMVDVTRRRAAELGLQNVAHRVLDAEDIKLEDDSVDRVLCRFGYMLMADPAKALAETRRVLRPGGRLAFAVWSAAERNPWASLANQIFIARGLVPAPEPGAPGMFTMANEAGIQALLQDAGFEKVRIEEVPVSFDYRDVDDYVERSLELSNIFATVWNEASEDERAALTAELEKTFTPFAVTGGYVLPGAALCVVAS